MNQLSRQEGNGICNRKIGFGVLLATALLALARPAAAQDQETVKDFDTITVRGSTITRGAHAGFNIHLGIHGSGSSFSGNPGQTESDSDSKETDCEHQATAPEAQGANKNGTSGNPILLSTGNKIEPETDFVGSGEMPLFLTRTYNKYWEGVGMFGKHWLSNFDYKLTFGTSQVNGCYPRFAGGTCSIAANTVIWSLRPDGRRIKFNKNATDGIFYEEKTDPVAKIVKQADGSFVLYDEDNGIETYSSAGYVSTVKNEHGIGWTFTYVNTTYPSRVTHTSGRYVEFTWTGTQMTAVRDPAGNYYGYSYTANKFGTNMHRLEATSRPGPPISTIAYYYEVAADPGALTGKSFDGVRYSWFTYDANGYATGSRHEYDQDKFTFSYTPGANGLLTVVETNPLGKKTTYTFENGNPRTTTGHTSTYCASSYAETTYDSRGYAQLRSDFNGNDTTYTYNNKGQMLTKVEAYGTTFARKTTLVWDATRNLVTSATTGGVAAGSDLARVSYAYTPAPDNRIATITITNLSGIVAASQGQQRVTTFAYTKHPNGMLATVVEDGPLSGDKITTSFSAVGDLLSIKNELNHTVTYSGHNALGLPATVTGVNGDITEYLYDSSGRVTRTRTYPSGMAADVSYTYSGLGLPLTTTYADGTVNSYAYSSSHRLISIRQNETAAADPYALKIFDWDLAGNITEVSNQRAKMQIQMPPCTVQPGCWPGGEPPDPEHVLVLTPRYNAFTDYDELGRTRASRGNNGQNVRYTYDLNGNVKTITDSLNRVTTLTYDVLDRVVSSKDPLNGITSFDYDLADHVTKVTDPRGKITTYQYDGFGQMWRQVSPDTGTTDFVYGATGLLTTMTRSNGAITTYGYDGMGRTTSVTASGQSMIYGYDTCTYGKGRLCTMNDPSGGSASLTYAKDGRLTVRDDKIMVNGSLADDLTYYYYDNYGRLNAITYPGGMAVGYGYAFGRLKAMTVNISGTVSTVITETAAEPFGPSTNWTYGNGLTGEATRDLDWRTSTLKVKNGATALQNLGYTYNVNNEITQLGNSANTALTQSYGYDALSRLTSVTASSANQSFAYDANGNRTSHTWGGQTDLYGTSSASNQLTAITGPRPKSLTNHVTGVLTANAGAAYTYDPFLRLKTVTKAGIITTYVVNAQGQRVSKTTGATTTRYRYSGQNGLLSESTGSVNTNYLWFNGKLTALVRNGQIYYVHTDHLGRPEIATNSAKAIVWRANNYAFDRTVAIDSIGGLNFGLPGQYYDAESGLWNNGFRDYDSSLGRYVQSDPIGLMGGTNTYTYVAGNPVGAIDPLGLEGSQLLRAVGLVSSGPCKNNEQAPQGSVSSTSRIPAGTAIGLVGGATVGTILAAFAMAPESGGSSFLLLLTLGEPMATAGVAGGGTGALYGAVAGGTAGYVADNLAQNASECGCKH